MAKSECMSWLPESADRNREVIEALKEKGVEVKSHMEQS